MKITEFATYLQKLEQTSKRLEITSILAELISKLDTEEIDKALYLSQGGLKALYQNPNFSIADKMMIRVLESAYGNNKLEIEKMYGVEGDLGNVAAQISPQTNSKLTISDVYPRLLEIAQIEGTGSQDLKVSKLSALLKELDPISAKYIVRIVLGTTRLGFTELTIIDALAQFLGDKKLSDQIEAKYNVHPDLGIIAKKLKSDGIKGIHNIKMDTGVPILPQKPQRVSGVDEIMERLVTPWAEFKFDGTRVQLHMDRKKKAPKKETTQKGLFSEPAHKILIKTYTRNLEETTHQFPDILEAAESQLKADSAIIDGEAIGYNKETGEFLPFQEIMQRKRKHDIAEIAKEIPLKYFVFDLLYLNGKALLDEEFIQRRKLLESIVKPGDCIELAPHKQISNVEKLTEYFEEAKEHNLEGLICKKLNSKYQAGGRSYAWVKYKRADEKLLQDTVDVVILGYYFGKGVRTKFGIGTFLVGIYDKDSNMFKTFTKVGTGLTDEEWVILREKVDKLRTTEKPANVDVSKIYTPDVWVQPKVVVEIGGDEISKSNTHSAGYALRFPRLIKFREDKLAQDATSLEEITLLHNKQKRGYYNSNGTK